MEATEKSPQNAVGADRRREPRHGEHEQLIISDLNRNGHARSRGGWSFDTSESGISFRCRELLTGPVIIEFNSDRVLEAEIKWSKEVISGVWEYGASLRQRCEKSEKLGEPLSEAEIRELISLPADDPRMAKPVDVQSVRELAKSATKKVVDDYQGQAKRASILRMVAVLAFGGVGAALASLGLVPAIMQVPCLAIVAISLVEVWRCLMES